MKKFIFLSFAIGIFGATTIFAVNEIKSATVSSTQTTLDDGHIYLRNDSVPISNITNTIPEHFILDGIAKTTSIDNTYIFEGVIKSGTYQFGNPFPTNKDDQLTFVLNSIEYVSGEYIEEDESILRVTFGGDSIERNTTGFNFIPKNINEISLTMPARETANNHITIRNISDQEVKYSFTLTIE